METARKTWLWLGLGGGLCWLAAFMPVVGGGRGIAGGPPQRGRSEVSVDRGESRRAQLRQGIAELSARLATLEADGRVPEPADVSSIAAIPDSHPDSPRTPAMPPSASDDAQEGLEGMASERPSAHEALVRRLDEDTRGAHAGAHVAEELYAHLEAAGLAEGLGEILCGRSLCRIEIPLGKPDAPAPHLISNAATRLFRRGMTLVEDPEAERMLAYLAHEDPEAVR
jgi:hypothetical protein